MEFEEAAGYLEAASSSTAPVMATEPSSRESEPVEYTAILVPKKCFKLEPLMPGIDARAFYVVSETADFRLVAQRAVRSDDVALELGASYGVTTQVLGRRAVRVVAIETSEKALVEARKRCTGQDNINFCQCDVLRDFGQVLEIGQGATAVFVDIGGDRLCEDVLWLLRSIQEAMMPRLLCVKGRAVWRWVEAELDKLGPEASPMVTLPIVPERSPLGLRARSEFDNCRQKNHQKAIVAAEMANPRSSKRCHPLSYPDRTVPNKEGSPRHICRCHNFLDDGCDQGQDCEFDHDHCYLCGVAGHRALICSQDANSLCSSPQPVLEAIAPVVVTG